MIDNAVIDNVRIEPLTNPRFVKPLRIFYSENGAPKSWEYVKAHDSVAILIYNEDQDEFIIVRQFRPAVYAGNNDGYTYELCAGILDKNKSELDTAIEEIEEETGFLAAKENVQRITGFYSSVGISGSRQTLFFARVKDRDRVSGGGGVDTENIEVIRVKRSEVFEFIFDESKIKTSGLAFAFILCADKLLNERGER